jgi:hypothetical protein
MRGLHAARNSADGLVPRLPAPWAGPPPPVAAFSLPSSVLKQVTVFNDFEWRGVAFAEVAVVEGKGRVAYTAQYDVSVGVMRMRLSSSGQLRLS